MNIGPILATETALLPVTGISAVATNESQLSSVVASVRSFGDPMGADTYISGNTRAEPLTYNSGGTYDATHTNGGEGAGIPAQAPTAAGAGASQSAPASFQITANVADGFSSANTASSAALPTAVAAASTAVVAAAPVA